MSITDITVAEIQRDEALLALARAHILNEKFMETNLLLRKQHDADLLKLAELVRQVEQIRYTPQFLADQLLNDLRIGRIPLPTPAETVKGIPAISASDDQVYTDDGKIVIPVVFKWSNYQSTIKFAFQPGLNDSSNKYPDYQGISWEKPAMTEVRRRVSTKTK